MSDSEEDAGGFGGADESEEEEGACPCWHGNCRLGCAICDFVVGKLNQARGVGAKCSHRFFHWVGGCGNQRKERSG